MLLFIQIYQRRFQLWFSNKSFFVVCLEVFLVRRKSYKTTVMYLEPGFRIRVEITRFRILLLKKIRIRANLIVTHNPGPTQLKAWSKLKPFFKSGSGACRITRIHNPGRGHFWVWSSDTNCTKTFIKTAWLKNYKEKMVCFLRAA